MASPLRIISRTAIVFACATLLYALILGALLTPNLQRLALYAHKINTLFWDDLNQPHRFGFAQHQVTPFNIPTPDGETLYAWHVLPVDVYARHEKELQSETRQPGPVTDFKQTTAFRLLKSHEPEPARVVVYYDVKVHGNAGHIAQGWRPDTFRSLTLQPNTHVVTIDYRGFGYSTGWPTEAGLINDGTALVDFVLDQLKIEPERIVIMGQSLGTAVSSAVSLNFANPNHDLLPPATRELQSRRSQHIIKAPIAFAGVVLVAPFYSIPSLLLTYRMGGMIPILLPLRPFPSIARQLTSQMIDQWPSGRRLAAYYDAFGNNVKTIGESPLGMLQIIHARNDMDISYHQTEMICAAMLQRGDMDMGKCISGNQSAAVLHVDKANSPTVRFEILERGGHNRVATYSPVSAAVLRAFSRLM
ncbi:Hypothetical protein R9X50_00029600 [Acrodontium crateriforme]|uniref:AB hydrolase-1 domain-containing protein n=1 Tax=Acrodontium crateriforme TaxID=150365 RepID=A0AAQ3LX73_9PEZI|nr:Hypothetical protein R9X50_00029600 [Acrodontium crateriforme]